MIVKPKSLISKGIVEFTELHPEASRYLSYCKRNLIPLDFGRLEQFIIKRFKKGNLVYNFPRQQYAKLDRGETPEAINARYLTLTNNVMTNPTVLIVSGEIARIQQSTQAVDPSNSNNSIIRFIIDIGQFIGSWKTAVLIGGSDATASTGTGKIIASVNDIKDDSGAALNRDGTTLHFVSWKLKHLDSSEV